MDDELFCFGKVCNDPMHELHRITFILNDIHIKSCKNIYKKLLALRRNK